MHLIIQMPFGDMVNLQTELSKRFKLAAFAAVICGEPYVRLSANVYNTIEDYHKLGQAILQLVAEDDA